MSLGIVPLPRTQIMPMIYRQASALWLFTDGMYRPNGWLHLYRESLSDNEVDRFLQDNWGDGPHEARLVSIFNHFRLSIHGLGPGWGYDDADPIRDAVHRGHIKLFKIKSDIRQAMERVTPIGSPIHPLWSSTLVKPDDGPPSTLQECRNELACAFGEIVLPRWRRFDAEHSTLYAENIFMRGMIRTGAVLDSARDALMGSITFLWDVGKVVFTVVGNTLKATVEFFQDISEGNFSKIAGQLQQVGLGFINSASAFKKAVSDGLELLNLVIKDALSADIVRQFMDSLKETVTEIDKYRIAGGLGLEVVLALATLGAGLIITGAKLIGGVTIRVIQAIRRIAEMLTASKSKKTKSVDGEKEKPQESKPIATPKPLMAKHNVDCFKAGDKIPPSKYGEYDQQVSDQQKGLNDMTVKEYLDGRENYKNMGRGDGKAQREARADYAKIREEELLTELAGEGIIGAEAAEIATDKTKSEMSTLDALHNPDMITGGKDQVSELGDRSVNRSIGAQWNKAPAGSTKGALTRVEKLDIVAEEALKTQGADTKMNANMHRCK